MYVVLDFDVPGGCLMASQFQRGGCRFSKSADYMWKVWKYGFMPAAHPEFPWRSIKTHGWIMLSGCNLVLADFFDAFVERLFVLMHFHTSSLATLTL